MTAITASMVKELRELTGAGMMECKKALVEANGDIQTAIDNMRKSGQAKAAKKAGRVAAEGAIVIASNPEKTTAHMLEINCETDFVARDENFKHFANALAQCGIDTQSDELSELMAQPMAQFDGMTAEQAREALIVKIGENIQVRRFAAVSCNGVVGHYLHGDRIGVLVALDQENENLAKEIAMHIAAMNPLAINAEGVSPAVIEKEREIASAQAQTSGKPANIIEKMVDGRIQKFLKEVCLVDQPFIKNPDQTINDLLKAAKANVISFVRFEVGEGIEKQTTNLAEEVSATLKGSE